MHHLCSFLAAAIDSQKEGGVFSKIKSDQWIMIVSGAALCFFAFFGIIGLHNKIKASVIRWSWIPTITKVIAYVGAVGGTIALDWFEPWKQTTWKENPGQAMIGIIVIGFCGETLLLSEWTAKIGEVSDRDRIGQLEALNNAIQNQLNGWVHLSVQISQVISAKVKRLRELASKQAITIDEFLGALNPEQQFYENVFAIHQFYKRLLTINNLHAKLRLAIYRINPKDPTGLIHFVSWDGDAKDCVKVDERFLKVVHPDGVRSVVAKCHNSPGNEQFIVIPDCGNHPDFEYFEPGQRDYLKSMVAFKYQINIDGTKNALVIALDCDQVNFFSAERSKETKTFLVEMMKRIEYELLTSEIAGKLTPQKSI